jgi:methylmalonyl-CoA mutase N-terminal domain/subunit
MTMYKEEELGKIHEQWERWHRTYDEQRQTHPERRDRFSTVSNQEIHPLYSPLDVRRDDFCERIGFPGSYPYTRGIHPNMYRGRLWTMRMFAGMGQAEETNERFRYLLSQGQTGLSVAFDMPTLMGRNSDDPMSQGEVGKCGVAIDTLADMEILFNGIPLEQVTTSMTINPPASILLAMYVALAEKQGIQKDQIGGTIQNDMLKEFIAQKTFMLPLRPSMRLIVDTIEYCTRHVPHWNPISISGYHIREAGSTAVQELAFTLADGIAYVEAATQRGLHVDQFAPRLSFFFNAHIDFFEEIAKYRAARRMWAKIMRDRFGAKDSLSCRLRFHSQTAGCSLTAQQPYNNVIRTTVEALAAVLGGTQSLHTNSLDEVLALPSQEAATIALRTQQIIAEETGVANAIDPLAGSYLVEALTNEIEEHAWAYIQKIDELGGMVRAIEVGYPQREIAEAAYTFQKQVDSRDRVIVGVNQHTTDDEIPVEILRINDALEHAQIKRIKALKRSRDNGLVSERLLALRHASEGEVNLIPYILDAVKAYASLQEICDVWREVFGEFRDPGDF